MQHAGSARTPTSSGVLSQAALVAINRQYSSCFFWSVMVTTGIGRDVQPVTYLEHVYSTLVILVGATTPVIIGWRALPSRTSTRGIRRSASSSRKCSACACTAWVPTLAPASARTTSGEARPSITRCLVMCHRRSTRVAQLELLVAMHENLVSGASLRISTSSALPTSSIRVRSASFSRVSSSGCKATRRAR